ncbi:MAG: hypothetical protein M3220_04545 [Chloroflexota bacterium]|nr:hypothetical protein [Chloroflexota bacterium]
MEFREYWRIVRKYWWLIVLLPLLAGAFTVLTYEEPPITYGYELKYSVSFVPAAERNFEQDPVLSAVQASEYVADDLTEVFPGSRFATFIQQYLPGDEEERAPVGAITSATRVAKVHRLVTVSLTAETSAGAEQLGEAFKQATEQDLEPLLNELWGITPEQIRLELVNETGPFAIGGGLPSQLDLLLRVSLALVAAVALAFALDYLDDSVRSREEVERLVGPVLGEIPTSKG